MGELITRISGNSLPKNLREKYSAVEHIKEADRIVIDGIEKESKKRKRIHTKRYVESYGYDPSIKPDPVKGIWQGAKEDLPITVVGSYGRRGGDDELMRVRGRKEGIPRSEIKWQKENEDASTIKELRGQISVLTSQNSELAS